MKLRITLALAVLLALLVAPQALAAPGKQIAKRAAKAACKAELAELGRADFREKYGRGALRACVRAHFSDAVDAVRNAAQECRAEYKDDRDEYGTNRNGGNAFGKCVSQKVREALVEEDEEGAGESPAPSAP